MRVNRVRGQEPGERALLDLEVLVGVLALDIEELLGLVCLVDPALGILLDHPVDQQLEPTLRQLAPGGVEGDPIGHVLAAGDEHVLLQLVDRLAHAMVLEDPAIEVELSDDLFSKRWREVSMSRSRPLISRASRRRPVPTVDVLTPWS